MRVKIKATSIDTGHPDRDAHLRSNDFFAMDEYPDIEFTSTSVKAQSDDTDRVTGDLTIRGVSKAITFDASATAPSSIRGATHASASPAH